LEIGVRGVGSHADARSKLISLGGLSLVIRGGRTSAQTSEQINFPTCCRADRVLLLVAFEAPIATSNASYRTFEALTFSRGLGVGVDVRQELGAGTGSRCARLLNACKCRGKIEILR